jgi:SAM-dependent methyltransferase
LPEPVLDIGCGDGKFFRLVWPDVRAVVGVDHDPAVVALGRKSGVYQAVYLTPAHDLPFESQAFGSCFANCSLEHMDRLPDVLSSIARVLRPGAPFVLSVVTDKFLEWTALPGLVSAVGEPGRARLLQQEFEDFHHLVSPFTPHVWRKLLEEAGFDVVEHLPIVPELTSRLYLLMDQLWHVRTSAPSGEVGGLVHPYLASFPEFPRGLSRALRGVLDMERDWSVGSGAVFRARRTV